MTKQIELLSTETNLNKNTSSNMNKEEKTQSSLFDKLLSKANLDIGKNNNNKTNENILVKDLKNENIKTNTSSANEIEVSVDKKLSLLDRLVLEAKNSTIDNNSIENKKTITFDEIKQSSTLNNQKTSLEKKIESKNTNSIGDIDSNIEKDTLKIDVISKSTTLDDLEIDLEQNAKTQNIDINTKNKNTSTNDIEIDLKQNLKDVNTKLQNGNSEKVEVLNTKLAKDLSSINDENIKNEKINITKEEIVSLKSKTIDDIEIDLKQNSKSVINNIYLSSQKNSINNSALSSKTEIINSVKNAINIQNVSESAEKLGLNMEDINIEITKNEIKKDVINTIDRISSLDKLVLNKNVIHNEIDNLISKSVEASKAIFDTPNDIESEVSLNINTNLANNIQARIIGARQEMSSMMSDIARKMYENYKPPVTAFRINLNPATLGHIAITMKNDKDSGINISLNISNSSTLDTFIDNQSTLRNALAKTFEDANEFNLDFSSSDQKNNSNNQEASNKSFSNEADTQTILESREKNLESEDRNIDYM